MKDLRALCDEFIQYGTRGALVLANDGPQPCPICQGPMKVWKTSKDQVAKTIAHGTIVLWETSYVCAAEERCRYPSGDLATRRAKMVAESLIPKRQSGYDVMAFVGTKRYIEYQQRDEILKALDKEGIDLGAGTESDLVNLFAGYFRVLHDDEETIRKLRQVLEADGGYWIHIDATGENGRGTTVAVYAGKRHWVLDTAKISTENADEIFVVLRRVVKRFGIPLAIMSDMGPGILGAIKMLLEVLGPEGTSIRQLICHLHYVRDIGKDVLKSAHNTLGKIATDSKIRTNLRRLERDLTEIIGDKAKARDRVEEWTNDQSPVATQDPLPPGTPGSSVLRSLVQWTGDYRVDGANDDFPFSQRNLDFYNRCVTARKILARYRQTPPITPKLRRKLDRFHRLVDDFCDDAKVVQSVERLRARIALWEELRVVLRLFPEGAAKSRTHVAKDVSAERAKAELQDIKSAVNKLCDSYRARRPKVSKDLQKAIDVILRHMDDWGHLLWGHIIKLPDGRIIVIDRTDNALENFWGSDKRGERRRSGHKNLTHDLETKPADALLAHNLNCPDYVEVVCGTLGNLPRVFAKMDTELRQKALTQPKPMAPKDALPRTVSELLASMSSAETDRAKDRKLIRSKEYAARIALASQARRAVAADATEVAAAPAPAAPVPETAVAAATTSSSTVSTELLDTPIASTVATVLAGLGPEHEAACQLTVSAFMAPETREFEAAPTQRRQPRRPRRNRRPDPSVQASFQTFMQ